jgi:acetyl esterase/lipase
MRLASILLFAASLIAASGKGDRTPEHFNISLWERGSVPLAKGEGPLDEPFVSVFLPPENKRNGTAVVVAPGGANIMLMYGAEGLEIAERFNDWGAAAFVLTYRLAPRYGEEARVADGNRALRLVRARARQWGIAPDKIGFAGFSAGSFLARSVVRAATPGDAQAVDPIERVSSRPDFVVMVYGPGRAAPGEDLSKFPPTFLLSAAWDRGAANGTVELFQQLNKAGAVAELHIYQKGRHGFGAAFGSEEFSPWMDALRHFLIQNQFLPRIK